MTLVSLGKAAFTWASFSVSDAKSYSVPRSGMVGSPAVDAGALGVSSWPRIAPAPAMKKPFLLQFGEELMRSI
jgi:hypothetical protein